MTTPPTPDVSTLYQGAASADNAFVTELNTTGSGLVYYTYLGGTGYSYLLAITVDASGSAYVTGYDNGNDSFPVTSASTGSSPGCAAAAPSPARPRRGGSMA